MSEVSLTDPRARIRAIVAEVAPNQPAPPLEPETRLVDDLLFDSVAILELMVALESDFDIPPISPADSLGILTIEQLEAFVLKNTSPERH